MLPPGWISYTCSVAVPLDVEGLTRPPLAAQCPLRRPGVGVVLLSHCWLWGRGGWGRGACTAPVLSILGPSGGSPHPSLRSCAHASPATHSPVPSLSLAPSYLPLVRRRLHIEFVPPRSSSAPSSSVSHRIPQPYSLHASLVLHTLVSQQGFGRRSLPTALLQWRSTVYSFVVAWPNDAAD